MAGDVEQTTRDPSAPTMECLIAGILAQKDAEIERLRTEVAELRGVAKQLSNDVRDADDDAPDPRDARIAELTTDLALSQDATLGQNRRAVAAEARIAELEAALRELMRWADHYELMSAYPVPGITLAVSQARCALGEEAGRG